MAIIKIEDVARRIGVAATVRTVIDRATGEEKEVPSFSWRAADLPALCMDVHSLRREAEVELQGGGPAFVYAAVAHGVHPAPFFAGDPKLREGRIAIPELPLFGYGNGFLAFECEEREEFTLLEFSIQGGIFDEDDLPKIILPAVNPLKGVVVSGVGPVYLHAAFARSVCHKTRWVGTFAPQMQEDAGMERPAVVVCRHHKSAPAVGTYVSC